MKLLLVNGPNLNLLGQREQQIYGNQSFSDYFKQLKLNYSVDLECFQSNHEGEIIDKLQDSKHDAIILNAGGYSHTSVSIRDCVKAIGVPVIEVHISNIAGRESFRHDSLISPVSEGCIFGFGLKSYDLAINYCINHLIKR